MSYQHFIQNVISSYKTERDIPDYFMIFKDIILLKQDHNRKTKEDVTKKQKPLSFRDRGNARDEDDSAYEQSIIQQSPKRVMINNSFHDNDDVSDIDAPESPNITPLLMKNNQSNLLYLENGGSGFNTKGTDASNEDGARHEKADEHEIEEEDEIEVSRGVNKKLIERSHALRNPIKKLDLLDNDSSNIYSSGKMLPKPLGRRTVESEEENIEISEINSNEVLVQEQSPISLGNERKSDKNGHIKEFSPILPGPQSRINRNIEPPKSRLRIVDYESMFQEIMDKTIETYWPKTDSSVPRCPLNSKSIPNMDQKKFTLYEKKLVSNIQKQTKKRFYFTRVSDKR